MTKPHDLIELIDELKAEHFESSVDSDKSSKAVIYLDPEYADDEDGIELSRIDCDLLFHDKGTVERLMEALKNPAEPSLVLHSLTLTDPVLRTLEECFVAVDEE